MNSSQYKLFKEAKKEFYNYYCLVYKYQEKEGIKKSDPYDIFYEWAKYDPLLKGVNKKLIEKLANICVKEQKATAKKNLNNVLGRRSHLFHVVFPSIWPFLTSIAAFFFVSSLLFFINNLDTKRFFIYALIMLLLSLGGWFRAIIDEATFKGYHTLVVRKGLHLGFWLFLVSE